MLTFIAQVSYASTNGAAPAPDYQQRAIMNPLIYVVDDDEAVRDAVGLLMRSVQLPTSLHGDADSFLATFEQRRS